MSKGAELMASKRSKKGKSSVPSSSAEQSKGWKRFLLLVTLTPLAAGLLLIFGAVFDMIVWISPPAQALLGGLFVLGSFVIFNALQNQWNLALGWLLFGLAIWMWLTWLDNAWLRLVAYALGASGLVLLGIEFVRRYREQQVQVKKRKR